MFERSKSKNLSLNEASRKVYGNFCFSIYLRDLQCVPGLLPVQWALVAPTVCGSGQGKRLDSVYWAEVELICQKTVPPFLARSSNSYPSLRSIA